MKAPPTISHGRVKLVLVAALCGCSSDGPAELTRSSILLITTDTTRADALGCYGGPDWATPHLDQLAAEGIQFQQAHSVAPVTLPSHSSMMTGLYPYQHGVRDNSTFVLPLSAVTLAEVLQAEGYRTSAVVASYVLNASFGLGQGFDHYSGVQSSGSMQGEDQRSAEQVTDEAIEFLHQQPADQPFFLWVHYFDPHMPYAAPAAWAERFPGAPYDAEIAYMDAQIGRLHEGLAAEELRDETLIAVVADHGEGLGDHGEATHAMLIYDSVMRVPMLLSAPSVIPTPSVIDDRAFIRVSIGSTWTEERHVDHLWDVIDAHAI